MGQADNSSSEYPGLFTCPRHNALRLTPNACADFWSKASRLPRNSMETIAKCKGCAIGAGHAGKPLTVAVQRAACISSGCTRCGESAMKLVFGRLCVSCYNRQRDAERGGRDCRGRRFLKYKGSDLHTVAGLVAGERTERMTVTKVLSGMEALRAMALQAATEVVMVAFADSPLLVRQ